MGRIQARLAAFESKSGLVIPADLAEHFRLLEKGKREVWKDMYQFYSFDAFKSIPTGVALFRGIPDYRGIVNTLAGSGNCFGFADWMIMSFEYAIRLYREPTAINEVYVIYKDEFKQIADSFTGFLELLERDAEELLF